jgi:PLD-like domain
MNKEKVSSALRAHFNALPPERGRAIASAMTESINNALLNGCTDIKPVDGLSSQDMGVLRGVIVQPKSLCLPWQCFNEAAVNQSFPSAENAIERIVATAPLEYDIQLPYDDHLMPYEGSLLRYLAELIERSKKDIVVMNPYWSIAGIKRMRARVNDSAFAGKRILLMTPPNMMPDHHQGCMAFIEWAKNCGATVNHRVPKKLSNGQIPLVHAKCLIADRDAAYLGSANWSDNAFLYSIEMGLIFSGPVINSLCEWVAGINEFFEENHSAVVL